MIPDEELKKHNLYQMCEFQNIGFINTRTFHTFDMVFGNFKNHMTNVVERMMKIKFKAVENPKADADAQRKKLSPKEMLGSSYLPRAIVNYNIDINTDPLVDIRQQQQALYTRSNGAFTISNIRQKRLGKEVGEIYSYMRDIDFSIFATPKLSTCYMFYTIMVNEAPLAYEIARQLKYHFPLRVTNEWFASITNKTPYGSPDIVPYRIESLIPNELIEELLDVFELPHNNSGKETLIKILDRHSQNRMYWKVDASTGEDTFACTYASPMWVTCTNIDVADVPIENLNTYVIRVEFQVDWFDLTTFKLSGSLLRINKDCEELQVENQTFPEGSQTAFLPVPIAYFEEEINGTTIWDTYSLRYTEDDVYVDKMLLNGRFKELTYIKFTMSEVTMEPHLNEYIKEILKGKCKFNHDRYFNVAVKRHKLYKDSYKVYGTDPDIELDYANDTIKDFRSNVDDDVWVTVYINKPHYHQWLIEKGYNPTPNYSTFGE